MHATKSTGSARHGRGDLAVFEDHEDHDVDVCEDSRVARKDIGAEDVPELALIVRSKPTYGNPAEGLE